MLAAHGPAGVAWAVTGETRPRAERALDSPLLACADARPPVRTAREHVCVRGAPLPCPLLGIVLEQQRVEHVFDHTLLVRIELGDSLELQAQRGVGVALCHVLQKHICGDSQRFRKVAQDIKRRVRRPGFVTPHLSDVHTHDVGERLLAQMALLAQGGEAFGEFHRRHSKHVRAGRANTSNIASCLTTT